mgnify:CR=1 FL=1
MKKYDYLIVGAGLYGATFAHEAIKKGKTVLVIDKRNHVGGNIYTENIDGINVHKYGAHIFHTSNETIWKYVNELVPFNNFINSPLAFNNNQYYHLPFNMYTFQDIWGIIDPVKAKEKISEEIKKENITQINNLEDQALSLVGRTIYELLIKGYTEKQWGKSCKELPSFIIKRIPIRYEFNNNYFNDKYQGIPIGGYTKLINLLLEGSDIQLNSNYFDNPDKYHKLAKRIVYTGAIDEYFNYKYGQLEYRSLRFELEKFDKDYYQKNCVINFTNRDVPYTRIIEHKYFEDTITPTTIITKEYPDNYEIGKERYYPINDKKNTDLFDKYLKLAKKEKKVIFGGRLANYKYYDMDDTIEKALLDAKKYL